MKQYIVTDVYGEIDLGEFKLIPDEIYLSNGVLVPNDESLSEDEQVYVVLVTNKKTGKSIYITQYEFEDFLIETSL